MLCGVRFGSVLLVAIAKLCLWFSSFPVGPRVEGAVWLVGVNCLVYHPALSSINGFCGVK